MADQSNNLWNILSMRPGPVLGQGLQDAYIKQDDRVLPKLTPGWETRNADRRVLPYASYLYCEGDMRLQPCQAVSYEQLPWFAEPSKSGGTIRTLDFPSVRQNTWTNEDGLPVNATEDEVDKILKRAGQAQQLRNETMKQQRDRFRGEVSEEGESYGKGPPSKRQKVEGEGEEAAPSYESLNPSKQLSGSVPAAPQPSSPPESEPEENKGYEPNLGVGGDLPSQETAMGTAAAVTKNPLKAVTAIAGDTVEMKQQEVANLGTIVGALHGGYNVGAVIFSILNGDEVYKEKPEVLNAMIPQFEGASDVFTPNNLAYFLESIVEENKGFFAEHSGAVAAAEILDDINALYMSVLNQEMIQFNDRTKNQITELQNLIAQDFTPDNLRRLMRYLRALPKVSVLTYPGSQKKGRQFERTKRMKYFETELGTIPDINQRLKIDLKNPQKLKTEGATAERFMSYFHSAHRGYWEESQGLSLLKRFAIQQKALGQRVQFEGGTISGVPWGSKPEAPAELKDQGASTAKPNEPKQETPVTESITALEGDKAKLAHDPAMVAEPPKAAPIST